MSMVDVRDVTRTYGSGPTATAALRGVTFSIGEGRLVALRGRSGSGKTTLLNVVGGLDSPSGGTVHVAGQDVTGMGERGRMRLRRETVAYIFQSFGLLPVLSAAENVGVPLRIAGVAPREREERVALMLSIVGLADHSKQRPGELSGGQQQRVAIATAIANKPSLLLADEPTGELDSVTADSVFTSTPVSVPLAPNASSFVGSVPLVPDVASVGLPVAGLIVIAAVSLGIAPNTAACGAVFRLPRPLARTAFPTLPPMLRTLAIYGPKNVPVNLPPWQPAP